MSKQPVSVYLDEKEVKYLKDASVKMGYSVSLVLRMIVKDWISRAEEEAAKSED